MGEINTVQEVQTVKTHLQGKNANDVSKRVKGGGSDVNKAGGAAKEDPAVPVNKAHHWIWNKPTLKTPSPN